MAAHARRVYPASETLQRHIADHLLLNRVAESVRISCPNSSSGRLNSCSQAGNSKPNTRDIQASVANTARWPAGNFRIPSNSVFGSGTHRNVKYWFKACRSTRLQRPQFQQRLASEANASVSGIQRVIKRLNPKWSRASNSRGELPRRCANREREHPVEPGDAVVAHFFVEMNDHFSVSVRGEAVSLFSSSWRRSASYRPRRCR